MLRISNHTTCRFTKKRCFSAQFWPGDAMSPPHVSPFSKLKRFRRAPGEQDKSPGQAFEFKGGRRIPRSSARPLLPPQNRTIWHFQFEMLRISNHTACRFAEKTLFYRSLRAGRRCAAASRSALFKGKTLHPVRTTDRFPHRSDSRRGPEPRYRRSRLRHGRGSYRRRWRDSGIWRNGRPHGPSCP